MAENGQIRDQKELAKLLKKQQEIEQKIADAIREGKETVDIGNKTILNVKLLEDSENGEKSIDSYNIESKNKSITARAQKDKKTRKVDVDVDFDTRAVKEYMDNKRRKEIEDQRKIKKHEVKETQSDLLKKEIEQKKRTGNAIPIELHREITDTVNMHMFISRKCGVSCKNLYRVKGKDSHDFKYVAENSSGKYEVLDLTSRNEGRNPYQKIWLMKDGKMQEKTVDSIMLKGNFGIATDFADNVASQHTTSYLIQRLPNGQYLGIAAAEKSGVNRTPSGNDTQKDITSLKSKYQMQDYVKAADAAKLMDSLMMDNKLTTEEVKLVQVLQKDKNLTDNQTSDALDTIITLRGMGFECSEIKNMMNQVKNGNDLEKMEEKIDDIKKDGNSKEEVEQKLPGTGRIDRTRI